jgi:hypothetical protein
MSISYDAEEAKYRFFTYLVIISFMGIMLSSMRTALVIKEQESTGNLSSFPFISLFTDSVTCVIYGLSLQIPIIWWTNVIPALISLVLLATFYRYSAQPPDWTTFVYPILFIGLTSFISFISAVSNDSSALFGMSLDKAESKQYLGYMMIISDVALVASPLSSFKTVLMTKSTATMPFWTSFFCLINALTWFAYGWYDAEDIYVWLPHLIGCFCGGLQMVLFIVFGVPFGTFESINARNGGSSIGMVGKLVRNRSKKSLLSQDGSVGIDDTGSNSSRMNGTRTAAGLYGGHDYGALSTVDAA